MKILLVGDEGQFLACKKKLGKGNDISHCSSRRQASALENYDLVIDFTLAKAKSELGVYANHPKLALMINSVTTSLQELTLKSEKVINNILVGFNGLPTFFERDVWEITALDSDKASRFMKSLDQSFAITDDRVGMVTPRVVCMIINEAYFTLQEGTATREDIDMAMKLGTNYPYGPFEWSQLIGIKNVYDVLSSVYEDTKDERYKICPLLKKEYQRSLTQR
ncbi:MAG: 3-hydroxyacyl-CoA dehydrogenase family protein [Cyclobacteriaceae bacterium]